MNFVEFSSLKKEFSEKATLLLKNGKSKQESAYETKKLPKQYSFNGFIDSSGETKQKEDLPLLEVSYDSILLFNFLGWSNSTQSNQLSLFSELFTSAKTTHQVYSKSGLRKLYQFDNNEMKEIFSTSPYDVIVGRGDAIPHRLEPSFLNDKTDLITLQPLWETNLSGFVFDNKYLVKVPPPFMTSFFQENFDKVEKNNYILYPATVNYDADKNQRGFAHAIEKEFTNNHKIIFCGPIRDKNYASEVSRILNKKNIDHCFTGRIDHYNLRLLYLISKGICLYSNKDFSPRAICEGTWAGLPYITKKCVPMPADYEQFGRFFNTQEKEQFNKSFLEMTNFTDHKKIHNFCKANLSLSKVYYSIFKDISKICESSQ